jgi:dTDP-glucose 4,6-dehydratase
MNRVLITGGAGFIGANFTRYWLNKYPKDRVIVLDALTYAGNLSSLADVVDHPNFHFVKGDICDQLLMEGLVKDESINLIVHFAAESHVDRSITGPDAFIETNIVGTHTLLKVAKKVWLDGDKILENHRFHHVSTDEVYGTLGFDDPPFTETTPYQPTSPYSASKAASDHLVRAYHHTYGLQISVSNCSNNYGPLQFPEKLIPVLILNILHGKPLPIYGDGKNIRDWLYVDDHCVGIDLVINKGSVGETYNIGGENEKNNIEIVSALCQLIDRKFTNNQPLKQRYPDAPPAKGIESTTLMTFVQDRPGHDLRYAIAPDRICKELGYKPMKDFGLLLEKTLNWYLDHEEWWSKLIKE